MTAHALEGRWSVIASTFPMWTAGRRFDPTFEYSRFRTEGGAVRFDDTVAYLDARGKRHTIEGVDTVRSGLAFTWRGKGLLWPFTSRWEVLELAGDWALIAFGRTLATPAGLDVMVRPATPFPPLDRAVDAARRAPHYRHLVDGLRGLPRGGPP